MIKYINMELLNKGFNCTFMELKYVDREIGEAYLRF